MLTQPVENPSIPGDMQKAIESAKNAVTMHEAEAVRLKSLINSLEYTIVQRNNEKGELESKIAELEETSRALSHEVAGLLVTKSNSTERLEEIKRETDSIEAGFRSREESLKERESAVAAHEQRNAEWEKNLTTMTEAVKAREVAVTEKEEKIRNFQTNI